MYAEAYESQVKDDFKYAFISDVCHRCLCLISDKCEVFVMVIGSTSHMNEN